MCIGHIGHLLDVIDVMTRERIGSRQECPVVSSHPGRSCEEIAARSLGRSPGTEKPISSRTCDPVSILPLRLENVYFLWWSVGDHENLWKKKRSVCIGLSFSFYKRVAWPYKFTLWPKYYNMLVVCSKFVPSYFLFKSACWCFNDYDFITTILSGKKLCSKIEFAE